MKVTYLQIHDRIGQIVPVGEVQVGEVFHYISNYPYSSETMFWRNGNRAEMCGHKMKHADNKRGFFANGYPTSFSYLVEIVAENYHED